MNILALLILSFALLFLNHLSFAAIPSPTQQMSGQERARQMQEQEENLQGLVEQPNTKTKIKEKSTQESTPEGLTAQRVLIKSINVIGVTVFPDKKIRDITRQYENKELTLKEIQEIADRITDLYRKKGYVISRAYIPAQRMEHGILEIRVIESKIGDILLKGNRYYSTKLIESYLTISASYTLGNNINATGTEGWNSGAGFIPIGNSSTPFTGTFDGNSYIISNLFINLPSTDYVGLFGYTSGSTISNVGLINANITGQDYVGGLVGYNYSSSSISNSYATSSVTSSADYVGGLVGFNYSSSTVTNSYATGSVTGYAVVGGLVGFNYTSSGISNSFIRCLIF